MSVPLAFPAPRVLLELMPTTVARNGLTITPQTIAFMYSPVVSSLLAIFRTAGISPTVQFGDPTMHATAARASLGYGDLYIFIGEHGLARMLRYFIFQSLRKRGIYTIYYQSEPRKRCIFDRKIVDEIWDFSWYNIDACANGTSLYTQNHMRMDDWFSSHSLHPINQSMGATTVIRYVPLVALHASPTVKKQPTSQKANLVFFGGNWSRGECLTFLDDLFKFNASGRLRLVYNVWSEDQLRRFLGQPDVGIFLNIHQGCRVGSAPNSTSIAMPVTWRNPLLLNARALIVSERCYWRDEAEFEGLVDFTSVSGIPSTFEGLRVMRVEERTALAERRHAAFSSRFDASKIGTRAQLPLLMQQLARMKAEHTGLQVHGRTASASRTGLFMSQ